MSLAIQTELKDKAAAPAEGLEEKISVRHLNFYYGEYRALADINVNLYQNKVTAFIGPSGCGKSTLLRCFNRMNDLVENARAEGQIGPDHVVAELGEVAAGAAGRVSDGDITLFKSLGLAVEDVVTARLAYERARDLDLGTEIGL
jgi:ABC-type branched-subunit amino acid transport system ATPase component